MQSLAYRSAGTLAVGLGGLVVATSLLLSQHKPATAVPAFAAQTGQACTACHVGGFGPQLTPFGRAFKLSGYTQSGGSGWEAHMPLSAMLEGSFTHTQQSMAQGAQPHGYDTNNNWVFDQASIFVAGRVTDHTGGFMQFTYSNYDNRQGGNGIVVDNSDLRPYTTTFQAFGNDLEVGLTINNNPTVQDPFNSSFAWGYPFYGPKIAPGPSAGTLISGGASAGPSMAGNSIGITAYAWYNEHLYLEAGGYQTMSSWMENRFGVSGGPITPGIAPYLRAAYEWDWGNNAAWVGAMFMRANFDPQFGSGLDSYTDFAIDGGYQFLGDGTHIVTVQGIYVHEFQGLNGSTTNYNVTNGTTVGSDYGLNSINANVAYWYKNTYGVTLAWQSIWGDNNPVLYGGLNANGSPDTNDFTIEADWVPFGKEKSLWRPWANLKVGASYTVYTKLDGVSSGAGNNNTFFLFAWTAF
ncbi:MAG: hypothetical protein KGI51_11690 [Rhodospirillales bacterium]|nr:hypothetical protein [Rhodospirillales bacterium]